MHTQPQWCAHRACPDVGKLGGPNITVYSDAARRYDCTTCSHTLHADRGTFFDTGRTDRQVILHVMAMLVERHSRRAIGRSKHGHLDTTLHWLDRAGHQAAVVSRHFMTGWPLPQAQIDERWTCIKKNRNTFKRVIPMISGRPGCGEPWPCPVACVWCILSRINVVRQKRSHSSPHFRPERMVAPPD
jgi:hypothetical protein